MGYRRILEFFNFELCQWHKIALIEKCSRKYHKENFRSHCVKVEEYQKKFGSLALPNCQRNRLNSSWKRKTCTQTNICLQTICPAVKMAKFAVPQMRIHTGKLITTRIIDLEHCCSVLQQTILRNQKRVNSHLLTLYFF